MRLLWTAVAAGLLLLAGCGDEVSAEPHEEESMSRSGASRPEGVSFDSSVRVADDRVVVSWTLENDGDAELLVTDRVPLAAGSADWGPARAYVVPGEGGVEVAQRAFAWPDTDRTWAQAPEVGITRLAPGESLSRRVVVALPLTLLHPFGRDLGDGPLSLPAPPTDLTFCLGVLVPPFAPALGLAKQDGVEAIRHGNAAYTGQHVFCSARERL